MQRLGGSVIGFADPGSTRAAKGSFYEEGLKDTIKVVQTYSDVIVIRHYESGAAARAAGYADIPVLNAGDGTNEHPTQCLLDLYTMWRLQGRLDGMAIALVGDLTIRAMRSLTLGLSHFDSKVYLVSPPEQRSNLNMLDRPNIKAKFLEVTSIDEVLPEVDVVYIVAIKNSPDISLVGRGREGITPTEYQLSPEKLRVTRDNLCVLSPLPRSDELPIEVDEFPQAKYFDQAFYGMVVRMALLAMVFDRDGLF